MLKFIQYGKFVRLSAAITFCSLLFMHAITAVGHDAHAEEMVIGEVRTDLGIDIIFEAAVKDHIVPTMQHLPIDQTAVHLEARVNWAEQDIPEGTPAGGFVPYLIVDAFIRNEKSGRTFHAALTPHVNLIDNFHYARNIALPGAIDDTYTLVFHIRPPERSQMSFHQDWLDEYGETILKADKYEYKNLNFEAIAKASR